MANDFKRFGTGTVEMGRGCSIGENVQIIFSRPATVKLGDYVTVGDGVKLVVDGGDVTIGDWTTLHADTLVLSKAGVAIGQHCWFGQNAVLDGTGGLTVENGVRVGMYSQLWSHVAAGEQIEGCTLHGERPIHVEQDVWLVGSCIVASGVRIGRRTVALIGSNLTKDAPPEAVLVGSPAKVKEGLAFYKSVTLDEKFEMLGAWLQELTAATVIDAPNLTNEGDVMTVHWDDVEKVTFRGRLRQRTPLPWRQDDALLRREQALRQGHDDGGAQRIEVAGRKQGALLYLSVARSRTRGGHLQHPCRPRGGQCVASTS